MKSIKIYSAQLSELTLADIEDVVVINLHDPENQTEEQFAHIQKLALERDRVEYSKAFPDDDDEAMCISPSGVSTPIITDEMRDEECWTATSKAYKSLVADGGRPSHPIDLGRDAFKNPEKYKQYDYIIEYWSAFVFANLYGAYVYQLEDWQRFRRYQNRVRAYTIQGKAPQYDFEGYVRRVVESQPRGIPRSVIEILPDQSQQHRVADWCEYRAWKWRYIVKCTEANVKPKCQPFVPRRAIVQGRATDDYGFMQWMDDQYPLIATECGIDLADCEHDAARAAQIDETQAKPDRSRKRWRAQQTEGVHACPRRSQRIQDIQSGVSVTTNRLNPVRAVNSARITKSKVTNDPGPNAIASKTRVSRCRQPMEYRDTRQLPWSLRPRRKPTLGNKSV